MPTHFPRVFLAVFVLIFATAFSAHAKEGDPPALWTTHRQMTHTSPTQQAIAPQRAPAIATGPGSLESAPKTDTNWFRRHLNKRLERMDQEKEKEKERDRQPDLGWKLRPGVAFRMKRKGMDWSIGPRLGLSKLLSSQGKLTLNGEYLPLKFSDLKSGSRIEYSRFDVGYRHFFSPKMFAGIGYAWHRFSPSGAFREEVASRKGQSDPEVIQAASVSVGHQVFKVGWSFRGKKRVLPFFLELSYQEAEDFNYGADLGAAGSEFRIKSGFSARLRPLTRKF